MSVTTKIINSDLRLRQYDIKTLEDNIDVLHSKTLVTTQKLTADFCIKYILDMDIESGNEDSYIFDFPYILFFQKHLSYEELCEAFERQEEATEEKNQVINFKSK